VSHCIPAWHDRGVDEIYVAPGRMTSPGRFAGLFADLPSDPGALARIAQGLVMHEFLTGWYGFELPQDRRAMVQTRPVEDMLAAINAEDDRPLSVAREPAARFVGDCRHFTVLTVAMLRSRGVPARSRCGFGGYFNAGVYEDHWVAEYWSAAQRRWVLLDAQIDDLQRERFVVPFDPLDVPRDQFVVAGQAWAAYRAGEADPAKYGLSGLNESGDWWIAANLVRDVAALNNMEMLPWDCWGAIPKPDDVIEPELFDRLAEITRDPAFPVRELTALYESDDRLRVPRTIFNANLQRMEELAIPRRES
jgi:hypothetical protein